MSKKYSINGPYVVLRQLFVYQFMQRYHRNLIQYTIRKNGNSKFLLTLKLDLFMYGTVKMYEEF
jgi:hypothetical protein